MVNIVRLDRHIWVLVGVSLLVFFLVVLSLVVVKYVVSTLSLEIAGAILSSENVLPVTVVGTGGDRSRIATKDDIEELSEQIAAVKRLVRDKAEGASYSLILISLGMILTQVVSVLYRMNR